MEKVKHILIVHQGAIGDFILSLPAIGSFRYHYPDASIEIWGYPGILRLVEKRFYADRIASIDRKEIAQFYSENAALDVKLLEQFRRFDFIIIFGGKGQRTLLDNLRKSEVQEVHCINTFPQSEEGTHIIDYQLSQLSRLGYKAPDKKPKLFPSENDRRLATDLFTQRHLDNRSLKVAMHIGSGSKKKVWSASYFAKLSEQLIKDGRTKIILPIGPADEEVVQDYFNLISSDALIPLVNLPLNELAAVLQQCDLYVGNDSGITHLATAVGTPVVALFGPTDPKVWGPRGDKVFMLYKGLECSPCTREKMRVCMHLQCMEAISVEEVYREVKGMIHDGVL